MVRTRGVVVAVAHLAGHIDDAVSTKRALAFVGLAGRRAEAGTGGAVGAVARLRGTLRHVVAADRARAIGETLATAGRRFVAVALLVAVQHAVAADRTLDTRATRCRAACRAPDTRRRRCRRRSRAPRSRCCRSRGRDRWWKHSPGQLPSLPSHSSLVLILPRRRRRPDICTRSGRRARGRGRDTPRRPNRRDYSGASVTSSPQHARMHARCGRHHGPRPARASDCRELSVGASIVGRAHTEPPRPDARGVGRLQSSSRDDTAFYRRRALPGKAEIVIEATRGGPPIAARQTHSYGRAP